MSNLAGAGIPQLINEIKAVSDNIRSADDENKTLIEGVGRRIDQLERSINDLYVKTGRPGPSGFGVDDCERADAAEWLTVKHALDAPRDDGLRNAEYRPTHGEVDTALTARRAFKSLLRTGDLARLDEAGRKSLSSFSYGTNSYLMRPVMANRVLSCLVNPSDLSGLVDRINISGPSVKFLIDNERMGMGAWACQQSCFANNPQPDLQLGLGELEIKPEPLRYIACVSRDLVEDSAVDIEQMITTKITEGMSAVLNEALIVGDGVSKPLGLLNPRSGIPVCETSTATRDGEFTWQDLIQLRFQIPMQWQTGAAYVMNQRTLSYLMTLSDSGGRPLWSQLPGEDPGFRLMGAPIVIASQMPDVAPGSTPIAYGNFKKAYVVVWRKAVTLEVDRYSAGWCLLYKAELRANGAPTCPNAVRLLRIR